MLDSLESCSACILVCRHLQRWAQAGYLAVHVSGVQTLEKLQLCQQESKKLVSALNLGLWFTPVHISAAYSFKTRLCCWFTETVQVVCQLFVNCFSSAEVDGSCTAGFWTNVPVWEVKQAHRGILFDAHRRWRWSSGSSLVETLLTVVKISLN